jgi:hypothetical protein
VCGFGVSSEKSEAPDTPSLLVRSTIGKPKIRTLTITNGVSTGGEYLVFNSTIDTLEKAIKERVFFVKSDGKFLPPPRPIEGVFLERMRVVKRALAKGRKYSPPLTFSQYIGCFQG